MLRLTEEDLKRLGYAEISPGKFKKISEKEKASKANPYGHIKRVQAEINGEILNFRSSWEHTYALYLETLRLSNQIESWEFEPKRFLFEKITRGTNSYLPDFKINELDGTHWWAEVKGHMDAVSKTKLKRMKKYFPNERVEVITKTTIDQIRKVI